MSYKLNGHDAAQKAQAMIFQGEELLIAAQRAKACGCDVIIDEEKGYFTLIIQISMVKSRFFVGLPQRIFSTKIGSSSPSLFCSLMGMPR